MSRPRRIIGRGRESFTPPTRWELPTTYDGKPLQCNAHGQPLIYYTKKKARFLCPQCVCDNLCLCTDKRNTEWYIVGCSTTTINATSICDICTQRKTEIDKENQ